jgi:hypothetical protein
MTEFNRGTIEIVDPKSDATREQVAKYVAEHPYGSQDENGIDITLIIANLRMTPDQRVRQAQHAAQQLARMIDGRVS